MASETGIAWTDSTYNSWWGCTKIAGNLACKDCYAEGVDLNASKQKASDGATHWGHGAQRRRIGEQSRNEPYRWNRAADRFEFEHGRRRRVFTLSMGDLFDNEVPAEWRAEHFKVMQECDRLDWQVCTKRVSNIAKMVPPSWAPSAAEGQRWPRHIGVLITIVTQAEADRDVPRLLKLKAHFGMPWVGISYEPAAEGIDWTPWLRPHHIGTGLDWIIFGGKSGSNWNDQPFSLDWARSTRDQCARMGTAFFMKQVAAGRPSYDMVPADLRVRQWPFAGSSRGERDHA